MMSEGRSEAGYQGAPGEVVIKLREIAWALDYGVPVITRGWRKQTAGELEAIAELLGGGSERSGDKGA